MKSFSFIKGVTDLATTMKSTTIRFQGKVLDMIHRQAKLDGKTSTEYMRDAVLDKLEDSLDYADAIKNVRESKGKTVSREDVKKQVGL